MGVRVREKDNAWWVFINHQGKRKAKRVGVGDAAKKAAQAAAVKIQAKLVLGDVGIFEAKDRPAAVPTFKVVADTWRRDTAPNWKTGTKITYENAIKARLLPAFGDLLITELTPTRVQAWWTAAREEGLSKNHLSNLRALLRGICRRAVSDGLLSTNPVERIEGRLGRQDTEIKEADYLTPEELAHLLRTAERLTPTEHPIFLTMAAAGLRISEAVGLQVGDLDAAGKRLHIRRLVRRGYISSPKNGKGRVVDLPTTAVAILERVRELRRAEAAYRGTEPRWLWPGEAGTNLPLTPEGVRKAFWKVLKAAGLRKVRPHDLRHTYSTLAIQAGVPLLTVSRQLGHASISTTADIYGHAVPGGNQAAAEVLEAVLTSNQTQPPRNLPS